MPIIWGKYGLFIPHKVQLQMEVSSEYTGRRIACLVDFLDICTYFAIIDVTLFTAVFLFSLLCVCVQIGKPLKAPKTPKESITPEMVDELHGRFVAEMQRLFDRTKGSHPGHEKAVLVMH